MLNEPIFEQSSTRRRHRCVSKRRRTARAYPNQLQCQSKHFWHTEPIVWAQCAVKVACEWVLPCSCLLLLFSVIVIVGTFHLDGLLRNVDRQLCAMTITSTATPCRAAARHVRAYSNQQSNTKRNGKRIEINKMKTKSQPQQQKNRRTISAPRALSHSSRDCARPTSRRAATNIHYNYMHSSITKREKTKPNNESQHNHTQKWANKDVGDVTTQTNQSLATQVDLGIGKRRTQECTQEKNQTQVCKKHCFVLGVLQCFF